VRRLLSQWRIHLCGGALVLSETWFFVSEKLGALDEFFASPKPSKFYLL
jgi:hypothetical protein